MNKSTIHGVIFLALIIGFVGTRATAQTVTVSEDFTGTTTNNNWYALNDACLTASSTAGTATSTTAGTPPGCVTVSAFGENLVGGYNGAPGSAQTLPDPTGNGALRFTNGCIAPSSSSTNCTNGGHNQNGAIISSNAYTTSAGLQITFKTVTYRGDSYDGSGSGSGGDSDGADGISFFLIDGSQTPNIGSYGGSLAYSCSNSNPPYTGIVGGVVGLGIDEFGNFLNAGDNTASGYGYQPNRIGMRGTGGISWANLLADYPQFYNTPTYLNSTSNQQNAVMHTCETGLLSDYNGNALTTSSGSATPTKNGWSPHGWHGSGSSGSSSSSSATIPVADYAAIAGAYKVLATTGTTAVNIADEYAHGGYSRQNGTPITYKLVITAAGMLTLQYSVNGAAWQGVIANEDLSTAVGTLPPMIRFGFAGSTGGGSNIHEVLCFKAASLDTSNSSAASNLQQSSQITSSTQAYFAYYNPNDWTGRLTANALSSTNGVLSVSTTALWDASCVLTGVASGSTCMSTGVAGPITAQAPTSRTILTWNGTKGVPFEWSSLTSAQQNVLDPGDSNGYRLAYLRGSRTEEVTSTGSGLYRDRDGVLSDIVDSSPLPIGQPVSSYPAIWADKLVSTDTMAENSGQSYSQYMIAEATRENVVYVGANDGFLHGFRAGAYNSSNGFVTTTDDGTEVLAYMPNAVLNTIHNATTVELDFSNPQYGHNFYVDASPGSGDLYYNNAWHTWLVGGLGAGGAAIYALDVTTPSNFTESNAASLVIGEWSAANLSCTGTSSCGSNLGNTFGKPIIRRLHSGNWALIFGNGFGSSSGDAGVYIITINSSTGAPLNTYYLSTGMTGKSDGIAYVSASDLDGDHVTDYLYAGDLLGNVWRFDLTSGTPSNWAAASAPLFTAASGQPITTSLLVTTDVAPAGTQILVSFGTGQQTQVTNTTPVSYASGSQSLYTVWDWNMTTWNSNSQVQLASLSDSAFTTLTGLSSPYTLTPKNLTTQTLTDNAAANTVDISSSTICWAGTTTCTGTGAANTSFGWSAALPGTSEQIIYNPELVGTTFVVNSVVPANNSPLACTTSVNAGFTYGIGLVNGGVSGSGGTGNKTSTFFPSINDTSAVGVGTNATGTSLVVTTSTTNNVVSGLGLGGTIAATQSVVNGGFGFKTPPAYSLPGPFNNVVGCSSSSGQSMTSLLFQNSQGNAGTLQVSPSCPLSGQRATWVQKR